MKKGINKIKLNSRKKWKVNQTPSKKFERRGCCPGLQIKIVFYYYDVTKRDRLTMKRPQIFKEGFTIDVKSLKKNEPSLKQTVRKLHMVGGNEVQQDDPQYISKNFKYFYSNHSLD